MLCTHRRLPFYFSTVWAINKLSVSTAKVKEKEKKGGKGYVTMLGICEASYHSALGAGSPNAECLCSHLLSINPYAAVG